MSVAPSSILIVLHGSIGDVTRALPLVTLIRRGFPKVRLSWAVEAPSFPLVEHYPAIDEVIVFDRRHWWRGIGSLLRTIRATQFDVVLYLQRHFKSGVISFFSGAPVRVGFDKADGKEFNWLFNNRFIERASSGTRKISHYMKFAELLGIPSQPIEWHFRLRPAEEKRIAILLDNMKKQYAVLFVGTRWQSKQWLPQQMADCARFLRDSHKLGVILLGGKEDHCIADAVFELLRRGSPESGWPNLASRCPGSDCARPCGSRT